LHLIDNGIDVEHLRSGSREQARDLLQIDASEFVVGCVASLTPEKSHQSLMHTFHEYAEELRNVTLVLVGDGPLRAELEDLADTLGLRDKILFLGHRTDVRLLYAAFDLFALVSLKEGLPMVLLEAMATGLSVVVTPVGAIPQVVTDGEQGYLVPIDDYAALAGAVLKLKNDVALRSKMGQSAYETVLEQYSSKRMADDYEKLYQKLLGVS
jgi:glycosyltransferase involved in cell wall biosynthesis